MNSAPQTFPVANSTPPLAATSKRGHSLKLVPLGESKAPPRRPYVVEGFIHEKSTFLIYGASQAGKSFLAIDLLLSVAAGEPWMGQNTQKGLVVYVASEGHENVPARVEGWMLARGLTVSNAYWPHEAEFNLLDAECVNALITAVKVPERGASAGLIIIDTLSSTIAGEDENSQTVMSTVMKHLRRIADKTGAAVGVVHHVSKANPREPRGNNALFAGVDTSFFVGRSSGSRSMEVTKQRDGATGAILAFDLQEHEIQYAGGATGTTCVVEYNTSRVIQGSRTERCHQHCVADDLLAVARAVAPLGNPYECAKQGDETRVPYKKLKDEAITRIYTDRPTRDAQRKQFSRDLKTLEDEGKIRREGDMIVVAAPADVACPPAGDPFPARVSSPGQPDGQDTPL